MEITTKPKEANGYQKTLSHLGEENHRLNDMIYRIQLTGEIPPLNYKARMKKSFKRFIKENIDMQDYVNKKYVKQMKSLQDKVIKLERLVQANHLDYACVSLHKTNRNYIRIATFLDVKRLLNDIHRAYKNGEEYFILPNGYKVKPHSLRYQIFHQNLTCVSCGLTGCLLALEKGLYDKGGDEGDKDGMGYHLNLYAINESGAEVLMTKDHIYPKSKGGRDALNNLQTMCTKCNEKKGDKI